MGQREAGIFASGTLGEVKCCRFGEMSEWGGGLVQVCFTGVSVDQVDWGGGFLPNC